MQRRNFLRAAAGAAAFFRPDAIDRARAASTNLKTSADEAAKDEDYWRAIQESFDVDRSLINFNNGGVCPSPRVVQEALRRAIEFSNGAPSYFMWRVLEPEIEMVRSRIAGDFGVDPEEIAITRNASESLEIVQLGMDLKAGDEVLTTDQDYPRMITTWQQRVRRDGIVLKQVSFPVPPPSLDALYDLFERNITSKTKVIHLCQITNLTGQIFPVKRICEMARMRGIEVIVDGAHAYAQFPFKQADLGCDYYGTSLHKWLLAPIGTGFLYVKREKIEKIWPMMAAPETMNANIRKFEEIGTHPAANHNAISEALTFHQTIGADRKAARLRYLRSLWTSRVGELPGVKILTSPDPAQSCGIVLVSVKGKAAPKVSDELLDKYRVFTVPIVRPDFEGIRVTPNIYTTVREVEMFASAMEKVARV
jgi:selenocysteine lyase/cysteine desulfurase